MQILFYKYQGTGNDFVLIDNRQQNFPKKNTKLVAQFCDRKFGVGADGLILLEKHPSLDFSMVYYNADGYESSMCGNGGRCMVHFASFLGVIKTQTQFMAIDGLHQATIKDNTVALQMADVGEITTHEHYSFLNTGSPHHVEMVSNLEQLNVFEKGRAIRNGMYGTQGANVNFVSQISEDTFAVRTYERGVEDETLSCGTGVTAVAIAMFETGKTKQTKVYLNTQGGTLSVSFIKETNRYTAIVLEGLAIQVYKGIWEL
ncbi:MAG: diaminopimelate epimerase [Flavobacteriales bacterium]|jgi:diaminopimelate epimerase